MKTLLFALALLVTLHLRSQSGWLGPINVNLGPEIPHSENGPREFSARQMA